VVFWLRVAAGAMLFAVNTVLHVPVLLFVALLKAVFRIRAMRHICDRMLMGIAESWIGVNTWMIYTMTRTHIAVESDGIMRYDGHYLVLANHQSWVDIPILQAIFNRKIPLLRFFLKSQLFWVPLLGLAWWALDFPFVKRYSRERLAKHPELVGRDIEATRRMCEKFRDIPVSIMNFVEGTRFTAAKKDQQQSPYRYLLKPRAGGIAFVLDAMGDALHAILDVTIVYPHGRPTLAGLFGDSVHEVRVHIRQHAIPSDLVGGADRNDPAERERAQAWINALWVAKDERMSEILRPR
jgi:1-acyl-sn-glycerol-3-phosphate acyltransferase